MGNTADRRSMKCVPLSAAVKRDLAFASQLGEAAGSWRAGVLRTSMDLVAATTTTDGQGRYTLCRLPALSPFQVVTPVKAGFVTRVTTVSVSGFMRLDLEMER